MTSTTQNPTTDQANTDAVMSWVMVLLTLSFVLLYGFAVIGKIKPLADVSIVSRLEPIIFVIIGYYFGRLPSQQTERTLKEEIGRQTQKADAAQHAKEQALQSREALEEKAKNLRATLTTSNQNSVKVLLEDADAARAERSRWQHVLDTAIRILDS
ncbi:MAG TPA: hypothetical protein VGQ39_03745 [Pyrinomonadaceae bacterium]|nr:hypothetical protein [Pyrinomonadaceae bacterium]